MEYVKRLASTRAALYANSTGANIGCAEPSDIEWGDVYKGEVPPPQKLPRPDVEQRLYKLRSRSWHRTPMSNKQTALMRRVGLDVGDMRKFKGVDQSFPMPTAVPFAANPAELGYAHTHQVEHSLRGEIR